MLKLQTGFPEEVRMNIRGEGDACAHAYDKCVVVHVMGPNFTVGQYCEEGQEDVALDALVGAYLEALTQIAAFKDAPVCVRLLPLSAGLQAGRYRRRMPRLTANALKKAVLL